MVDPGDRANVHEQIVLPPLVEDGVEHACREALAPHVPTYLDELAEARQRDEESDRTKPPLPEDDDVQAYLGALYMWKERNPSQHKAAEAAWEARLGIVPTGTLHLLFARSHEATFVIRSDVARSYMEQLAAEDAPFVSACRIAAKVRSSSDALKLLVSRDAPEERTQDVLDTWICNIYMTEAVRRLRRLGATDDEIEGLKR